MLIKWKNYEFRFRTLTLTRREGTVGYGIFSLRCSCGKLTLGCKDHRFCGLCEKCRQSIEDRKDDHE